MMLSTYIYKVSKNIKFTIYALCLPILLGQADTAPADESNDNKNQIIVLKYYGRQFK